MRSFFLALTLFASAYQANAQSLTPAEQTIVATVANEHDRSIALLERLVNQNSGTLNLAGVRAVGEMVIGELEPLGFDVRWIDMAETDRAGHLIATHNGSGPNVLLIGHLDTVFEPDSPFQTFSRATADDGMDEGRGPGVVDNKGGIVVMIAALRAMAAAGTLADADITIVLSGDEERPGVPLSVSRLDLVRAGETAAYALELEGMPSPDGRDLGIIGRRGVASWTLTTNGRAGHSSNVFSDDLGFGAIYEMSRILDTFRRDLREPALTYNVGLVAGGTSATVDGEGFAATVSGKTNIIAGTAVARGDIRAQTPEQDARVRARMMEIVADHLPGTGAELVFADDAYLPMAPRAENRELLAELNAVNRDLGLPEMESDPSVGGASDVGFVAARVPAIAGRGAAGWGMHSDGETADLGSLVRQAQRAAILIGRLSAPQSGSSAPVSGSLS